MIKPLVIVGSILVAVVPWMGGGSDPMAVIISVFGLLIAAFLLARRPEQHRVASLPLRILVGLWLGWAALSLLWSVNHYDSELWLLYALLGVLVFALTASLTLTEKAWALGGYVWIAVLAAAYGFYLYFTGDYGRFTSSFYWANPAAAFLLPAALIAGWRWLSMSPRWTKLGWLRLAQTLILGTSVWLTDSRGAVLAAAIVIILTLRASAVRRRFWPLLGVLVLTFSLGVGLAALRTHFLHQASVTPGSRFSQAAEGESTSLQDRWNYISSAVSIWKDHPLLGSGAGTYGTVHPQYQQRVISASNDAHNIFMQTLAEQGLIGLLVAAYVTIILAVGVWRGCRREPQLKVAAVGLAFLFIHFNLDIDDRYPALIALVGLLAGSCYQPWRSVKAAGRQRWAVPVLLLVALVLSASAYQSNVWATRGSSNDSNHDLLSAADSYTKAHTGLMYNPDNWTAEGIDYYTLASITNGSHRYLPLARDRADQAIARDPDDSQHYFLLARVDRLDNRLADAEAEYQHALRLDPWNHPLYYFDLATLQLKRGQAAAAQATARAGLALYPDEVITNRSADTTIKPTIAELLVLQAIDRLQHHDQAGAASDLNRALGLDPGSQDAKQLKSTGLGR